MMKQRLMIILGLLLMALLVACGGEPTVVTETVEVPVEVTRIVTETEQVEVEVTRIVEVEGQASTVTEQVAVTFAEGGDTLQAVLDRGTLKCGGNASLAGFGFLDPDTNEFSGFDVDFCAAIAAAVFGDATKFEVTPKIGRASCRERV